MEPKIKFLIIVLLLVTGCASKSINEDEDAVNPYYEDTCIPQNYQDYKCETMTICSKKTHIDQGCR